MEHEITADEAFKGYMRDADYRQKTTSAAELTRQVEQERQQLRQERETRVTQLDAMAHVLHTELMSDQAMLQSLLDANDIRGYLSVKQSIEHKQQLIQNAIQQRTAVSEQQEAESRAEYDRYVKEQQKLLQDKLPEWRDPKVRDTEHRAIAEYLQTIGYQPDEMEALSDHRAMLIVRDAMRYRQTQALKSKQAAATPGKPVLPGNRNAPNQSKPDAAQLRERAKRTHKDGDIVAFLNNRG